VVGDPELLSRVLHDEMRLGRIVYLAASRRFALDGKLDPETLAAFADLEL